MQELIDKLDTARSGGRDLDALIEIESRRFEAYAVGLNDEQRAHWRPVGSKGEVEEGGTRYHSPLYSFNIDAALRLVPEGMDWRIDTMTGLPGAIVCKPGAWLSHKTAPRLVHAATPALALCAAALLARASEFSNDARGGGE